MSSVTASRRSNNHGRQPYLVLLGQDDEIYWLEYPPDGRRVVTGSWRGTVRIWDLESGKQEGAPMEHESSMTNLSVTRDGTKIISSGERGRIKVWDIESHKLVKEWTYPKSYPNIAISPDGRLIAIRGWSVAIYTVEGERHIMINSIWVDGTVYSMCFSPSGNKLACGTGYGIRVYDVASGTLVFGPLDRHSWIHDVVWSRDGSRLFSTSEDETICSWNSGTGQQIGRPWTGHTRHIYSLSLSPDGSILASASSDKTVRFWNATTGDPIGQHLQHDKKVTAVRFSPSGESVACAGANGKICFWNVPWFNSVERQVSTLIRCTSVCVLITLSI